MATSGASESAFSGRSRFALRLDVSRNSQSGNSQRWTWQLRIRNIDGVTSTFVLDGHPWSANINGQAYSGSSAAYDFRDGATYHTVASGTTDYQAANSDGYDTVTFSASAGPAGIFGSASTSGSFAADRIPQIPSGIHPVAITAKTLNRIDLRFVPADDNGGGGGYYYDVQRATNSAFTTGVVTARISYNATAYSFGSLDPATDYYFRIRVGNAVGNSVWSSAVSGATLPDVPSAPTSLTLSNVGPNNMTLAWSPPASDGGAAITSYVVQRATNSAFTSNLIEYTQSGLSLTFNDLAPNTTYYYRVRAQNSAGSSSYSDTVYTTTISGAYVSNGNTWQGAGVFVSNGSSWLPATIFISDGTNWLAGK